MASSIRRSYSFVSSRYDRPFDNPNFAGHSSSPNKFRKIKRNHNRISRRKRRREEYWARRKESRILRLLESRFANFDMDDLNNHYVNGIGSEYDIMNEVAEWSKNNELAYWKSRATTLEIENTRLSNLLYRICLNNVQRGDGQDEGEYPAAEQDYPQDVDLTRHQSRRQDETSEEEDNLGEEEQEEYYEEEAEVKREPSVESEFELVDEVKPVRPAAEETRKRMNHLYGPASPKISGMETALQLNFDAYAERHKPPYWPNIPLNLK